MSDVGRKAILIVEDEPIVRMLVADHLTDLGYVTIEANDAAAALPVLEGGSRLDLMLTDVGLPGMDGHKLAEQARTLRPGLRILFATGYAEPDAGRGAPLPEGIGVVGKPFDLDQLAFTIDRLIAGAGP